jgi:hypothetical protein
MAVSFIDIPDLMLKLYVFDIFYMSYLPYGGLNGFRSMQEEWKDNIV